jgi:hypothetical protein
MSAFISLEIFKILFKKIYSIQKVNPILATNALNRILGLIHSCPDLYIEHKDIQNILLTLKMVVQEL